MRFGAAPLVVSLLSASALAANTSALSVLPDPRYAVLHSFQAAESTPAGPLVPDGRGSLYGTTSRGGPADGGVVFVLRTDGSDFRILHAFLGGTSDGFWPDATVTLDGAGRLYGTTTSGGAADAGTVFTIREDGSGFEILHSFSTGEGRDPAAPLTLDVAGALYGTTLLGGAFGGGTVFRIRRDGTDFQTLHAFAGGRLDGRWPQGPVLLDAAGVLFGTTSAGGHDPVVYPKYGYYWDGWGTVFRMRADGSDFRLLHSFPAELADGAHPSGLLLEEPGGVLYGTTSGGGPSDAGLVFSMSTNGLGFRILRSFTGGSNAEQAPGSIVLDRAGLLHGSTTGGIFRMRSDGSGYAVVRVLQGDLEGSSFANLALEPASTTLYASTARGGAASSGAAFRIETDGNGFTMLHVFAGFSADGSGPLARLLPGPEGFLYGTTFAGGAFGVGTVFRIRPDGTGFQLLHVFEGGVDDGVQPRGALTADSAGNIYGCTFGGPLGPGGAIFRLRADGTGFRLLHSFAGGVFDGAEPVGALTLDASGRLYGATIRGGPTDKGTLFSISTDGSGFRLLHTFSYDSPEGYEPLGSMVLDRHGTLYGVTSIGPGYSPGRLFALRTDGSEFRVLHAFAGSEGGPQASLIVDASGVLYGSTSYAGEFGAGIFFRMDMRDGFRVLRSFDASTEGGSPELVVDRLGVLYGTAAYGGSFGSGTFFRISRDGASLSVLYAFRDPPDEGRPFSALVPDGLGNFYGTTASGGSARQGSLFALSIGKRPVTRSVPSTPVRKP